MYAEARERRRYSGQRRAAWLHPRFVRGRGDLKGDDSPVGQGDVEVMGARRRTRDVPTTGPAPELTSDRFCREVLEGLVNHAHQTATPPPQGYASEPTDAAAASLPGWAHGRHAPAQPGTTTRDATDPIHPGLANEMLRELAQLLAEEGIDVDSIDVPGLDTLQRPLNRAVERRNMELFSPVGQTRDIALITLRLVVEAILAATLLDQVQPESPDNSTATVASCIGIALGLPDNWMCGQARDAPTKLGHHTTLPDTLFLARKARAFRSLDKLLTRQGGPQVLAGSALALALALATATDAWAQRSDTSHAKLIPTIVR